MKFPIYQIDAFAEELFTGNPAAIVVLNDWIDTFLMQQIAAENNLAETAFIVRMPDMYEIRWFTPKLEVDLCGHATLAAGYVVMNHLEPSKDKVTFISKKSGLLEVEKRGVLYELDFPVDKLKACDGKIPQSLIDGIGKQPIECFIGRSDCMLVYEKQSDIENLKPDFCVLEAQDVRGVIVTAPGEDVDFVSRFFAPMSGVMEDPVTGSAHTTLLPYWHKRTGKVEFTARQLSKRKGLLQCVICGDRVKIAGKAKLYLKGEILIK